MAPRQCHVSTPDLSRLESRSQHTVGPIGLGDKQEPRCLLVESVDNALAAFAGPPGERSTAPLQRVDECAGPIPRRRMHDHSCRLVDDENIVVFVDDVQRNGLG